MPSGERPLECGVQVVEVVLDLTESGHVAHLDRRLEPLGEIQLVRQVPVLCRGDFTGIEQPLPRVVANRLEHAEPSLGSLVVDHDDQ